MKTISKLLIAYLIILSTSIFSSCEQSTEPALNTTTGKVTNTALNKANPERPFKGTINYVIQSFDNYGNAFANGTGNLTHLGLCTTEEIIHYITHSGEDTFTAADGSQLHLTWEMVQDGSFSWAIDGGTGRFNGATGSGICPPVNPGLTFNVEYIGIIRY